MMRSLDYFVDWGVGGGVAGGCDCSIDWVARSVTSSSNYRLESNGHFVLLQQDFFFFVFHFFPKVCVDLRAACIFWVCVCVVHAHARLGSFLAVPQLFA